MVYYKGGHAGTKFLARAPKLHAEASFSLSLTLSLSHPHSISLLFSLARLCLYICPQFPLSLSPAPPLSVSASRNGTLWVRKSARRSCHGLSDSRLEARPQLKDVIHVLLQLKEVLEKHFTL